MNLNEQLQESKHQWLTTIAILESASEVAKEKIQRKKWTAAESEVYFDMVNRTLVRMKTLVLNIEEHIKRLQK